MAMVDPPALVAAGVMAVAGVALVLLVVADNTPDSATPFPPALSPAPAQPTRTGLRRQARSPATPSTSLLWCRALGLASHRPRRCRLSGARPAHPVEEGTGERLGSDPTGPIPRRSPRRRALTAAPVPASLACATASSYPLHFCPPNNPTSSAVFAIVYGDGPTRPSRSRSSPASRATRSSTRWRRASGP